MATYRIECLEKRHNRKYFQCGVEPLDTYFQKQVSQDMRRHFGKCFVAIDTDTEEVAGFYTMSASHLALPDLNLPDKVIKKLPRYPVAPVALIGRLAVSLDAQGQGLGSSLIINAINRISKNDIGVYAVMVDAKDDAAINFYNRHGFTAVKGQENRLILPVEVALKILKDL